jgi:hypothetical protein
MGAEQAVINDLNVHWFIAAACWLIIFFPTFTLMWVMLPKRQNHEPN